MTENWKKYLLKSGLPFEYEVKECFAKFNCTVWDEYSYIKTDENNIDKEFSYDIDVNYCGSIDFMVECKYKTEPTSWFFLPDPYGYQRDVNINSFLHPIDYFVPSKYIFNKYPYSEVQEPLGAFCLKGIEVFQNQFLELNIFKAINQLSYAFVGKVIQSFDSQINTEMFSKTFFFNVPIIITNAELRLIKENITTYEIENSNDIDNISKKYDFLFFHNKPSEALRLHNISVLTDYFTNLGEEKFRKKNKSFTEDINHFIKVIADSYCPEVILIMHHDKEHLNYDKLFKYIDFIIKPSEELGEKLKEVSNKFKERMDSFKNMKKG